MSRAGRAVAAGPARVAAVQLRVEDVAGATGSDPAGGDGAHAVSAWHDAVDGWIAQARAAGAALVLLPAYPVAVADPREWLSAAAELARRHDVYLAPGTRLEARADGGFEHVARLYAPDGALVGQQAQTHTTRAEEARGWRTSDRLAVWDTELGRAGFLIGTDAWVPEVGRILALQGAEWMLAPVAVPAPYSESMQVAGVWAQVQGNQTFGLEAGLVGELDGTRFEARSAVYAPCEMTAGETGFLARAPEPGRPDLVVADLDRAQREAVRKAYPVLGLLNSPLYRRYLPDLYRHGVAAAGGGAAGAGAAGAHRSDPR